MNLKEFVKTSLVEVIQGINEAISETSGNQGRAVINPTLPNAKHSDPKEILFDVAVTVQEDSSLKGGGGISVATIKFGAEKDKATSNTAVSRLTFAVPVAWPSTARDQY